MREKLLLTLLPYLYKSIILLITVTCRVRWNDKEKFEKLTNSGEASIISFWHENVLIIPWVLRYRNISCLISQSRDGEYITRCANVFGNHGIRGGTSSGSSKAVRSALRVLKKGQPVAITPDGPRGPAHQLQSGVLLLAALSKAPIIPFHIDATKQWRFNSWDGQKIPKPFSTIYVSIGETYSLTRQQLDEQNEHHRKQLETLMMDNVEEVEQLSQST